MIFGKEKKKSSILPINSTTDSFSKASLEEAALSRWRDLESDGDIQIEADSTLHNELEAETEIFSYEQKLESDQTQAQVVNLNTPLDEPINAPKPQAPKTPVADLSIPIDQDLNERFGSNLKLALGHGTVVDGLFSFETPVKIHGTLTGEVKSSSALIVGEGAQVKAKIQVGSLIILGDVIGDIVAEDLVEIRSNGSLQGNISARRVSLEGGGTFNGNCSILNR